MNQLFDVKDKKLDEHFDTTDERFDKIRRVSKERLSIQSPAWTVGNPDGYTYHEMSD